MVRVSSRFAASAAAGLRAPSLAFEVDLALDVPEAVVRRVGQLLVHLEAALRDGLDERLVGESRAAVEDDAAVRFEERLQRRFEARSVPDVLEILVHAGGRVLEDVAPRNLPRRQPEAPAALPGRVRLPLRSALARDRTLHPCSVPRTRRRAVSLSAIDGGANRIGREPPIRHHRASSSSNPCAFKFL